MNEARLSHRTNLPPNNLALPPDVQSISLLKSQEDIVRRKILATAFLIPFLIFLAQPLLAQDVDSARRFLESTYRLYDHNGAGVEMGGPYADRFYHSSLIALLQEDEKVMGGGVGVLDGDPICGCQDWDGIFDLKMKIRPINSDRVEAAVSFALLKQATTRD